MAENSGEKDDWDKLEILGKVLGAVLVPIVAVAALFWWNSERTQQQTAAALTPLAVNILTTQSDLEDGSALKAWAIGVMNSPSDPPRLTNEAASDFRANGLYLPDLSSDLIAPCRHPSSFLDEDNYEILLGRIGSELILCEQKKAIVIEYYQGVQGLLGRKININE